jgi:hypothetical protein
MPVILLFFPFCGIHIFGLILTAEFALALYGPVACLMEEEEEGRGIEQDLIER